MKYLLVHYATYEVGYIKTGFKIVLQAIFYGSHNKMLQVVYYNLVTVF